MYYAKLGAEGVILGVKTCEVFSSFSSHCFPASILFRGSLLSCSFFFCDTGELLWFLHQGRAEISNCENTQGGRGLPYKTHGDARRKETNLGVAQAFCDP